MVDSIVTQCVTEAPQLTNNVGHGLPSPLTLALSRQGRGNNWAIF